MTIEFFERKITPEQHEVPEEMRDITIDSLELGQSCLTPDSALWMGPDGKMWLDAQGSRHETDDLVGEDLDDYVRVMRLPEGFVADISHAREDYIDDVTGKIRFQKQTAPSYLAEGYTCDPRPVIGFISSEMELEIFSNIVKEQYNYDYDEISSPKQ